MGCIDQLLIAVTPQVIFFFWTAPASEQKRDGQTQAAIVLSLDGYYFRCLRLAGGVDDS